VKSRDEVDLVAPVVHAGAGAYSAKGQAYFAGARRDYVSELPANRDARILEIGCGEGETGGLALCEGKCGSYCGVEMCQAAADVARTRLTEVVVGDIERLEPPWRPGTFDVLVLSEVLEHLADPWAVLRKLRGTLRRGGLVLASSPNVSHYAVVLMLSRGDWALTDCGLMDRTHLRWFTPRTYREMFESCGYCVNVVREHQPLTRRAELLSFLTFGRFRHLFMGQIELRARRG
jgi:2-polyprenyl-3-methyl-5-hydroxy-6-metoxy-1,4-benzoquinol methylase